MRKFLRPKDVLFLGLAGFLDVFEEIRDPLGVVADSCKDLYGWVPQRFKKHNFTRLVKRSLKTGEIERIVNNGEIYLRLTAVGKEKTIRDFSMFSLQKQKWDKKWRLVIFDIAEVTRQVRDLLRLKLKKLGFGMLQESVWITPYDFILDLREFLEEKGLDDYVYVMEVFHLLAGDQQELARRVWKLEDLNESYQKLNEEIQNLKQMYIRYNDRVKEYQAKVKGVKEKVENRLEKDGRRYENNLGYRVGERNKIVIKDKNIGENVKLIVQNLEKRFKREINKIKRDIRERYLTLLLTDPCLPKELLPADWVGMIVKKEIKRL